MNVSNNSSLNVSTWPKSLEDVSWTPFLWVISGIAALIMLIVIFIFWSDIKDWFASIRHKSKYQRAFDENEDLKKKYYEKKGRVEVANRSIREQQERISVLEYREHELLTTVEWLKKNYDGMHEQLSAVNRILTCLQGVQRSMNILSSHMSRFEDKLDSMGDIHIPLHQDEEVEDDGY